MPESKQDPANNAEAASETPWRFHSDTAPTQNHSTQQKQSTASTIKWSASEFIEHQKNADWYLLLIIASAVLAAAVYLFTKDIISVVMIVVVAIVFGIFAARKPRVLNYQIDETGIHIEAKFYPYANFKSFAVVSEDTINSIWLMPLKRFMPILTIYFAPDDEQKIISVLGNFLPVETHQPDPIDRLMHRLRF